MSRSNHTPTNPDDTASQILSPITKSLQKHGITLDYTCKKLKESMEAKETKVFNDQGKIIYSDDLVAHNIRLKASVEALKLQQAYPAEKRELEITGIERLSDQELDERIKAKIAEKQLTENAGKAITKGGE